MIIKAALMHWHGLHCWGELVNQCHSGSNIWLDELMHVKSDLFDLHRLPKHTLLDLNETTQIHKHTCQYDDFVEGSIVKVRTLVINNVHMLNKAAVSVKSAIHWWY